jgi:hypothetical protein
MRTTPLRRTATPRRVKVKQRKPIIVSSIPPTPSQLIVPSVNFGTSQGTMMPQTMPLFYVTTTDQNSTTPVNNMSGIQSLPMATGNIMPVAPTPKPKQSALILKPSAKRSKSVRKPRKFVKAVSLAMPFDDDDFDDDDEEGIGVGDKSKSQDTFLGISIAGADSIPITIPIIDKTHNNIRPKLRVFDHEVILYRGDGTEIKKFQTEKTRLGGFLGKGIYLTDNIAIAETYRGKGLNGVYDDDILAERYTGNLLSENDLRKLFDSCFTSFCDRLDDDGNFTIKQNRVPAKLKKNDAQRLWDDCKKHLIIEKLKNGRHTVRLPILPKCGYISEFRFPAHELRTHTLDFEAKTIGMELATQLISNKTTATVASVISHALSKDQLIELILRESGTNQKTKLIELLAAKSFQDIPRSRIDSSVVLKLGYLGWRYDGGKQLGGDPHNAFVLQDDDFVNHFRVK